MSLRKHIHNVTTSWAAIIHKLQAYLPALQEDIFFYLVNDKEENVGFYPIVFVAAKDMQLALNTTGLQPLAMPLISEN